MQVAGPLFLWLSLVLIRIHLILYITKSLKTEVDTLGFSMCILY